MNIRQIATLVFCMCCAYGVSAQDRIFKRNGEIIDSKISLISGEVIVFKRFDNPDGPEYSIPKADVAKVKYKNGSQDIFEENNDRIGIEKGKENVRMSYEIPRNKNIVAFAPLVLTEHGYGIAVSWEHSIDKAGWVTVNIPFIATWNFADPGVQKDPLVYLEPGIKFYPTLNTSLKNKFSIGPSLVMALGTGTPSNNSQYYYPPIDPTPHQNHVMMGGMATIGANFFPTSHTYFGADFGMGYTYLNKYSGQDDATQFLVELSMKFGYRYESWAKRHPRIQQ